MEKNDEIYKEKGVVEIIEILKNLDNPENIIYKSVMHALALKAYITIEYGKNPTGEKAFKFKLSPTGERIVGRYNHLKERGEI